VRQMDRVENLVEHPHDRGLISGVPSDVYCFGGQRIAKIARTKVEFLAQGGEYQNPVGIICRDSIQRELQDLDLFGIEGSGGGVPASVVGQRGSHQLVVVTEICGPARSAEQRLAKGGVSRLALRGSNPNGQVDAQHEIGIRGPTAEVECLGVVAQGVSGGQRTQSSVAGLTGVTDRFGEVDWLVGGHPVSGEFAGP
jgi:hypothetical protein